MNKSDRTFRDELLDMEKPDANYREKYQKEIREMFEKKLTGLRKLGCVVGLIMGLGFAGLFGTLAVIGPEGFPLWGRFIWGIGAVFGLIIAVVEGAILKKGTINLKEDEMSAALLSWCVLVIMGSLFLAFSGSLAEPIKAVRMMVSFLFFFVMAAVFLLKAYIQRSELNTREKLLQIEYRLAELSEKLERAHSE